MLSELQQDVLITSNDISFTPSKNRESDSATKKRWQKREKDETEIRSRFRKRKKIRVFLDKNEMEGHKVKKMLGINKGGFTPYNYTSTIDGDIAQRQREEVSLKEEEYKIFV